jgi:protein-L-isoaspartate(D-aspartate) O-methyltransferase
VGLAGVEPAERLAAFVDRFDLSPAWQRAARAVPRHLFAPARAWCGPDDHRDGFPIDQELRPEQWWDAVYDEAAIITQIDDGAGDPATGQGRFTSSLSAPAAVFEFLRQLYVQDHHRVLEIGTGTGWTAALLSARVGEQHVTTVEIDQQVADQAAVNLGAAGFKPRLVVADGAIGWPDGALYDRAHVTCGVRDIPLAWIKQLRPGGVLVAPWMPAWAPGHKLRLVADGRGGAVGRFVGDARYMILRSQRLDAGLAPLAGRARSAPPRPEDATQIREPLPPVGPPTDITTTTTLLDPRTVVGDAFGADVAIAAQLPMVSHRCEQQPDGGFNLHITSHGDSTRSQALIQCTPDTDEYLVHENGPRQLWQETEAAYLRWLQLGRPDRDRFGLSIDPDGRHTIWLDSPTNPISAGL